MGINLFMHSVRLVLGDWRNALKVTGLLYLIYAIPALVLGLFFPQPQPGQSAEAMAAAMSGYAPITFIVALLMLVVYIWLAVTWHRYILLDETPSGQLPAFNQQRILAYAGRSILLFLMAAVLVFVISLIVAPIAMAGATFMLVLVPIVGIFVALLIGYRLGLVLPAAAVGKPLSFGEAWQATKGASGTIVVLALVSALASILIDLPALVVGFLPGIGSILATLWTLATGWVKAVIGVSILTTLYGYYVEKRNIPA